MVKRLAFIFTILAVIALLLQGGYTRIGQAASPIHLQGTFFIVWGDGAQGSNATSIRYFLLTEQQQKFELLVNEHLLAPFGGAVGINHSRVELSGSWQDDGKALDVQSIWLEGSQAGQPQGVYGPQPWVSILCKFADFDDEFRDLEYFLSMFSSNYPGLDHFWTEQSYDLANLQGSNAYGWYVLPQPWSYYVYNNQLDFERAAHDCTEVADDDVYFPDFVGINLMFNHELDGFAWGGSWPLYLDGQWKTYSMTWEPPWGYENITVIAHENGHGFGLPHSSGNYGQTYDNQWDLMSDAWAPCGRGGTDPIYGCLGQHTIGYHKDYLGWFTPAQRYVANSGSIRTITLERTALPASGNYLSAFVPIQGSAGLFYTVEARKLVGYDMYNPGAAVIIHEVDPARENRAHVIDIDGNGNTGDAGAMWIPGETFSDVPNGISVYINSATTTGFVVTIANQFTRMQRVEITGGEEGLVAESIPFTAMVSPDDATVPITYTWEASGLTPIVHVGGRVDNVEFSWDDPGSKVVTVTASNAGGSVVDTHAIEIGSLYPVVSIDGPQESAVGVVNIFTATSLPKDVALPITYTWSADEQEPITFTGELTSTVNFMWISPGIKLVQVTAENIYGSSSDTIPVQVRMAPASVELSGVELGLPGETYTFTASVSPITTTVPVTYVWTIDGLDVITHTTAITDTLEISWGWPGVHQLSVQASNPAGSVEGSWTVTIYIQVYLPVSLRN